MKDGSPHLYLRAERILFTVRALPARIEVRDRRKMKLALGCAHVSLAVMASGLVHATTIIPAARHRAKADRNRSVGFHLAGAPRHKLPRTLPHLPTRHRLRRDRQRPVTSLPGVHTRGRRKAPRSNIWSSPRSHVSTAPVMSSSHWLPRPRALNRPTNKRHRTMRLLTATWLPKVGTLKRWGSRLDPQHLYRLFSSIFSSRPTNDLALGTR